MPKVASGDKNTVAENLCVSDFRWSWGFVAVSFRDMVKATVQSITWTWMIRTLCSVLVAHPAKMFTLIHLIELRKSDLFSVCWNISYVANETVLCSFSPRIHQQKRLNIQAFSITRWRLACRCRSTQQNYSSRSFGHGTVFEFEVDPIWIGRVFRWLTKCQCSSAKLRTRRNMAE